MSLFKRKKKCKEHTCRLMADELKNKYKKEAVEATKALREAIEVRRLKTA